MPHGDAVEVVEEAAQCQGQQAVYICVYSLAWRGGTHKPGPSSTQTFLWWSTSHTVGSSHSAIISSRQWHSTSIASSHSSVGMSTLARPRSCLIMPLAGSAMSGHDRPKILSYQYFYYKFFFESVPVVVIAVTNKCMLWIHRSACDAVRVSRVPRNLVSLTDLLFSEVICF